MASIFGAALKALQPAAETHDVEVRQTPTDAISALSFSPTDDLLAIASWSTVVQVHAIGPSGANSVAAAYSHNGPVLCAQWGKSVKLWDLRTPKAALTIQLPERVFAMDVTAPLMVVGTAERHVEIYDLHNPTTPVKAMMSPLKYQTRTIGCFRDSTGWAIGSIEGRVSVQHLEESKKGKNFSFKCHREPKPGSPGVSSVNCISLNSVGTFSTAGSDGSINIWDYKNRTRLKTFGNLGGPVSATAFSRTSQYLAYAVSYDWSLGAGGNVLSLPNKVMIHACTEEEVCERKKK